MVYIYQLTMRRRADAMTSLMDDMVVACGEEGWVTMKWVDMRWVGVTGRGVGLLL